MEKPTTQLSKDEALREGTAVKQSARELMRKMNTGGEATASAYEHAHLILEILKANPAARELTIATLNLWAEIEVDVGFEDSREIMATMETVFPQYISDFGEEIANGNDEKLAIIEAQVVS